MTNQPDWKTIYCTDYSRLRVDTTGVYPPELDLVQEIEDSAENDDDGNKFEMSTIVCERQYESKVENDDGSITTYITLLKDDGKLPHPIHSYQEWFIKDLVKVGACVGRSRAEIVSDLLSDDPSRLAHAYEDIVAYHGAYEFDQEPRTFTEKELNEFWK
jgi:hypothetical protein